jgi:hypothetical protein
MTRSADVDAIREHAQQAAKRLDGSAEEDCPFAADELASARLWLVTFNDARAWMREHGRA